MTKDQFNAECRSAVYSTLILESAGLIAGKPEHRLSGGRTIAPASDLAAGPRSSDGSGTTEKLGRAL